MACVDAKDIPQSRKKPIDAIGMLQGYMFIVKRCADLVINIHRLIHLEMRNRLQKEGSLYGRMGKDIARLAQVLGDISLHNRVAWRSYMPHAYHALESRLSKKEDMAMINLLFKHGLCPSYDGRYWEAEAPFERLIKTLRTKFGADRPNTLMTMGNKGRWEEAEMLEVQVMDTCKTKLGVDHAGTLSSMSNLPSTCQEQCRWEEAEKLEVQVIETGKIKLGADQTYTLTSMANLAAKYLNQG